MAEQLSIRAAGHPHRGPAATTVALLATGLGCCLAYGWGQHAGWSARDLSYVALLAGGLVSGFCAGLLGIGGALITIPVLYLALPGLGVAAPELPLAAASTALFAMLPTTLVAAHHQRRRGALDAAWLGRLAPAIALGAVAGALLASTLRGPVLAWLFAAQSLCFGGRLILDCKLDEALQRRLCAWSHWAVAPPMAAFCACVGMGGGSLVTPFLRLRGLELRTAVATASALNLCIAFGGGVAFIACAAMAPAAGSGPSYLAAGLLGAAATAAVPHGVALAHRLSVDVLRWLVGGINVVAAVVLVGQSVSAPAVASPAAPAPPAIAALPELPRLPMAELQRLTLHALLAPLLVSDEPAAWAAHTELMPCAGAGRVSVDGGPVNEGATLPLRRPVRLRWQLADCWPLGPSWMGLTGTLEMTVIVGTERISADVHPEQLIVAADGARYAVTHGYASSLAQPGSAQPGREF